MTNPRRRRSSRGSGEQLRDEIINAAIDLVIRSDGARAPSIREVAREIGVTPPSIYLHFTDKDELMDAVCAQYYQQFDSEMLRAASDADTTFDRLYAQGMAYIRFAVAAPTMYRLAISALLRDGSELDGTLVNSAFAHLHVAVEELIAEGYYPPGDSVAMALQLWAAAHGVASMLVARPHLPPEEAEKLADGVLRAACLGQAVRDIDLTAVLPRQK